MPPRKASQSKLHSTDTSQKLNEQLKEDTKSAKSKQAAPEEICTIAKKVSAIEETNLQYSKSVQELKMLAEPKVITSRMEKAVISKISDTEDRKRNIILYNITESDSILKEENMKHDRDKFIISVETQ